jgi:predicted peptidase
LYRPLVTLVLTAGMLFSATPTGFLDRTIAAGNQIFRYQVYVPFGWNKRVRWPIVLFLHGSGERGDDGLKHTQVGIGAAVRMHADRYPAVIVFPQCRPDKTWWDADMQDIALKALDRATREFNGDPERTYLTGLSMGGYGTWSIAYRHPGRFAALTPICGGVVPPNRPVPPESPWAREPDPYSFVARHVARLPIWIFHGDADNRVPVTESRKLTDALKAAGAKVTYTEYPGVQHNSWDRAYAEPEFPKWLLSQRRAR